MPKTDPPEDDSLQIQIGEDGDPNHTPKVFNFKNWQQLTTTALTIGVVFAVFKPQDNSINKTSHDELKKAIEIVAENNKKNHEDLVILRNYIESYIKNQPPPVPQISPLLPMPSLHPVSVSSGLPSVQPMASQSEIPSFDQILKKKM